MVLDSVCTSSTAPSFSDIFTVLIWGCSPRAVLLFTCLQSNNRVESGFKVVLGSEIKPFYISQCVHWLHLMRCPVNELVPSVSCFPFSSDYSVPALWEISGLVGLRSSSVWDAGRTGNVLAGCGRLVLCTSTSLICGIINVLSSSTIQFLTVWGGNEAWTYTSNEPYSEADRHVWHTLDWRVKRALEHCWGSSRYKMPAWDKLTLKHWQEHWVKEEFPVSRQQFIRGFF